MTDLKLEEKERNDPAFHEPDLFPDELPKTKKGTLGKMMSFALAVLLVVLFFRAGGGVQGEGVLKAKSFIQMNAPYQGILKELSSKKGDFAGQGSIVARLENPELEKTLREKELFGEILAREAKRLDEKKIFHEKELKRKNLLFENGAISRNALDEAELTLSQTQAEYAIKTKAIESAQNEISFLKSKLDFLVLKAPFNAVILKDPSEKLGSVIHEGEMLFELADPSSFYVEFEVSEKDIERIHVGDSAIVRFDARKRESYEGEVIQIGSRTDEEVEKVFKIKHVVSCEIKLQKIPLDARYGMRARIRLRPVYLPNPANPQKPVLASEGNVQDDASKNVSEAISHFLEPGQKVESVQ